MKTLFFLILFTGISLTIMAQSFRPGYVITNNSDTTKGFIKYTGGNKFAETCVFKVSEKGPSVDYSAKDIKGYRMDEGKFYVSREVNGKMRFLEYLIEGEANLYFYSDKDGAHYFIETDNAGIIELTEPERVIQMEDGKYLAPVKYKGKLVSVLNDYDSIGQKVEGLKLDHNSLIQLAKEYHEFVCDTIDCIVFESKIKPVHFHRGLLAGVPFTKLNFGQNVVSGFSSGFAAGAFCDVHNIFYSNERIWLRVNAILQYNNLFSLEGTGNENGTKASRKITYEGVTYYMSNNENRMIDENHYATTSLDASLNMLCLKFPVTINYSFSMDNVRPFFGGGFTNKLIIGQNDEFVYRDFIEDHGNKLPGFLLGYRFQAGVNVLARNNTALMFEVSWEKVLSIDQLHNYQRLYSQDFVIKAGFAF